jgi:threonine/homoserine/homoserine lactone efflux protein
VAGLLVHLLPLALYAGFAPLAALVCVALLESPRPLRRAGAYSAGYVAALVAVAVAGAALVELLVVPVLSALLVRLAPARGEPGAGRQILSVGAGVALLALAAVRWRRRGDRPATRAAPAWLRAAERITPLRAFGLGVLLVLGNPDNVLVFLAAVDVAGGAGLGAAAAILVTGLVVVTAAAPVLLPLAVYAARPTEAASRLAALRAWIGRVSQAALTAALAAVGGWLVVRGLAGLLE